MIQHKIGRKLMLALVAKPLVTIQSQWLVAVVALPAAASLSKASARRVAISILMAGCTQAQALAVAQLRQAEVDVCQDVAAALAKLAAEI
jgi:hypothetical protein